MAQISVQAIGGVLGGFVEPRTVDQEQVAETVAVVVEKSHPGSIGLNDIFLCLLATGGEPQAQTGLGGNVGELGAKRLSRGRRPGRRLGVSSGHALGQEDTCPNRDQEPQPLENQPQV